LAGQLFGLLQVMLDGREDPLREGLGVGIAARKQPLCPLEPRAGTRVAAIEVGANVLPRRFFTTAGATAAGVLTIAALGGIVLATRGDRRSADAHATLQPTRGSQVQGTVTFEQEKAGVRVQADVIGLSPGAHGFHIHERGDCSAPDAGSAGEHFDPTRSLHGGPDAERRHAGDLGNLIADEAGRAQSARVDAHLSLAGTASVVGRAVVVHAAADDLTSQPAGNAGARVACGVIEPLGR
jgi:Cu-Zn family superoxide dismutase